MKSLLTAALLGILFLLSACSTPVPGSPTPTQAAPTPIPATPVPPTAVPSPTATEAPSSTPTNTPEPSPTPGPVPAFDHIAIIVMENREFGFVIGNPQMPNYNHLAEQNTLLTQYYGITHPSLPNYLAMIGGDTFGIDINCETCFINAPSLPDEIEAAGRTWRTYQEDLPSPCFVGSTLSYAQKHDPFIYFDPIRLDPQRCEQGVVPLSQLETDLANGSLPDFLFIMPNLCNSGHDCDLDVVDAWLAPWVERLQTSAAFGQNSLIVLTWDEGQGDHGCCGAPVGGGRVATVLISPLAKSGFQDDTGYTHYSLLRTISVAWDLPLLGHAGDPDTALMISPWKR